ncbi:hypothetical protein ASR47_10242 [Janthinobacterium psychrotolerans]|uniref:Uncharacterized protein n=1 Tax=Janthinobacterium psychrotolerans TaxID=1747903 RepID=A0A1A7C9U4_9BURK|nr:hypothetical protein ASR47_10242 [Janthinobacterium psychrotolerans]
MGGHVQTEWLVTMPESLVTFVRNTQQPFFERIIHACLPALPRRLEGIENLGIEAYRGADLVAAARRPATSHGKLCLRLTARHGLAHHFPPALLEKRFRQLRRIVRITPGFGHIFQFRIHLLSSLPLICTYFQTCSSTLKATTVPPLPAPPLQSAPRRSCPSPSSPQRRGGRLRRLAPWRRSARVA